MVRPLILLAAAATIAAPSAALAQAWPAGAAVVASASAIGPRDQALMRVETPARWRAPAELPPTQPAPRLQPPIHLADAAATPRVEIRPKAEWSDDQGLRFNWTKLAYKQRF